jgi:hypothetical protein
MERMQLDAVRVNALCPQCATEISAPYGHVVAQRHFLCDCGQEVAADMVKVSTAAMLGFLEAA